MVGPCLCGDPYCGSCGNPAWAEAQAAEEWTLEALAKAKLTPEEYKIVVSVGLAAVCHARRAAKETAAAIAENQAEAEAMRDWQEAEATLRAANPGPHADLRKP